MSVAVQGGRDGARAGLTAAAWAALETLLFPTLLLAATPLLAEALQEQGFGLWSCFLAVVAIGGAASAGTASATLTVIADCVGRGRTDEIAGHVREALALACRGFGLVALVLAVLVLVAAPFMARLGPPTMVVTVCLAGVLVAWIEHLDQVHAAIWKGMEAFADAARAETVLRGMQGVALCVVLILSGSVLVLVAAHLATTVLRLKFKRHWVLRQYPVVGAGLMQPPRGPSGEVRRRALWGWVQGAGGLAFGTVDRLLVGAVLGPLAIAQYSVGMQLGAQLHAIAAAALSILAPAVSRRAAQAGAGPALLQGLLRHLVVAALLSAIGYGALAVWGPTLIHAWLGWGGGEGLAFMLPLALAYFLLSLNVAAFHVLVGLGRMRAVASLCAVAGALSAVLALWWIPEAGLSGAAWSRVAYAALTIALLPMMVMSLAARGRQR